MLLLLLLQFQSNWLETIKVLSKKSLSVKGILYNSIIKERIKLDMYVDWSSTFIAYNKSVYPFNHNKTIYRVSIGF
jgi:hypothetical protein